MSSEKSPSEATISDIRQSTIRSVDLNGNEMRAADLEMLFSSLSNMRTLLTLSICSTNVSHGQSKLVSEAIRSNLTLDRLRFVDIKIASSDISAMFTGIKDSFSTRSLTVSGVNLGHDGLKALTSSLRESHNTLTYLDISDDGIGPECAHGFANLLKKVSFLITLELHKNKIGDEGARNLAKFLTSNPSLTMLTLNDCNIQQEGASALASAIPACSCLKVLSLADNLIGDAGIAQLGASFAKSKSLRTLSIARSEIGSEGAKDLSKNLLLSGITQLNLDGNIISSSGAKAIGKMLRKNKALTSLTMADCGFGDPEAQLIMDGLRKNKKLTELYFDGNGVTVGGLVSFVPVLLANKTLTLLSLQRTHVCEMPDDVPSQELTVVVKLSTQDTKKTQPPLIGQTGGNWRSSWRVSKNTKGRTSSNEAAKAVWQDDKD